MSRTQIGIDRLQNLPSGLQEILRQFTKPMRSEIASNVGYPTAHLSGCNSSVAVKQLPLALKPSLAKPPKTKRARLFQLPISGEDPEEQSLFDKPRDPVVLLAHDHNGAANVTSMTMNEPKPVGSAQAEVSANPDCRHMRRLLIWTLL